MPASFYKDRLVITVALLNEKTNLWQSQADISWSADGVRHVHLISSTCKFPTREEALAHMENAAKKWIDRQV